jgi:hypothetical protein
VPILFIKIQNENRYAPLYHLNASKFHFDAEFEEGGAVPILFIKIQNENRYAPFVWQ